MSGIETASRDGVRTVTIDRPAVKNALDPATCVALAEALREAGADPTVRCVLLTGAGGAFCAGADLRAAMTAGPAALDVVDDRMREFHGVIRAVRQVEVPVVALVDGAAVGFGCDLALACDLRVASDRAHFAELFLRVGLIPDGGGTFFLPRLVGVGRALELFYTGDRVDAAEALRIGMVNHVYPAAEAPDRAAALCLRLAQGPPVTFKLLKALVNRNLAADYDTALDAERRAQLACLRTGDFLEGVMAFFEKREPKFRGQ